MNQLIKLSATLTMHTKLSLMYLYRNKL